MSNSSSASVRPADGSPRVWFRFLLCCFGVIVGVRIFLIEKFGVSIAFGDDLDGIARRVLLAWENGTLTWSALFAAHNGDHRIVATRLWELLWYEINGSWDPKLIMFTKAPIFAAAATIFVHILAGALGRWRFMAGGLLTVLFAFPFAYANLIWAFQSQFDFFFLAAATGWLLLLKGRPVAALVVAALSILTLGAGPIIAASYVPYFIAAGIQRDWRTRKVLACCAGAVAIVLLGLASPTGDRRPHRGTPAEKALTLARSYAWPHSNLFSVVERLPESARLLPAPLLRFPSAERSWVLRFGELVDRQPAIVVAVNVAGALLVVAPTLIVLWFVIRRRIPPPVAVGPLALAGFAFLMLVATAQARAGQVTVEARFLDHVALAGFASLACVFVLWQHEVRRRRWLTTWAVLMAAGYSATMVVTLAQIGRIGMQQALAILQRYYATTPHDQSALMDGKAYRMFIVGDDPTQLIAELEEPGMERVLPRAVTAPGTSAGPASSVAGMVARRGAVIAFGAAAAAAVVVYRSRRRSSGHSPVVVPAAPA